MVTCHCELEAYNATKESSCSVEGTAYTQCAAKKQKQSIEDSESELASQEGDLDSHRSESESDSEPDPDGLSD